MADSKHLVLYDKSLPEQWTHCNGSRIIRRSYVKNVLHLIWLILYVNIRWLNKWNITAAGSIAYSTCFLISLQLNNDSCRRKLSSAYSTCGVSEFLCVRTGVKWKWNLNFGSAEGKKAVRNLVAASSSRSRNECSVCQKENDNTPFVVSSVASIVRVRRLLCHFLDRLQIVSSDEKEKEAKQEVSCSSDTTFWSSARHRVGELTLQY